MWTHPGKKLLFMGGEFGQWSEWNHDQSLDWHLLGHAPHQGLRRWVQDLNRVYRREPALHQRDFSNDGFEWVDLYDWESSIVSYLRFGADRRDCVLVVCNFTPVPRAGYRVGVPHGGWWRELLNSDASLYGGSGQGNLGGVEAGPAGAHGRDHSLSLQLPPLSVLVLRSPASGHE
jgi:1,4-alpha-glucan branching enzyme